MMVTILDKMPAQDSQPTGMAEAVLREIADHLKSVADGGERQIVTLRGLPLSPADEDILRDTLGTGEVQASLNVFGRTEITETAFAGVWWVKELNADGETLSEHIEIAQVPLIVQAHTDDMRAAAQRLAARDTSERNEPEPPTSSLNGAAGLCGHGGEPS